MTRTAWGLGVATVSTIDDTVLATWYPAPQLGAAPQGDWPQQEALSALAGTDETRRVRREVVRTAIDLDAPPQGAADAYLRLHLLSHCLVEPNTLDLSGIFGHLANVVWTSQGPCSTVDFEVTRLALLASHPGLTVHGVDKFPRLTDYVVPAGVRIADAARVRLGAHLAPGTTVMHEGFVNFNAGSLGVAMIEGRVSQGVVIGDGTDIGGGASIMGTLSGGGKEQVRIGRRTLLGANAGLGISLGDDCVVEAGLYLTAGTKVRVLGELGPELQRERGTARGNDADGTPIRTARELSGLDNVLFRRHSVTGAVEALPRAARTVELNAALHSQ